MIERKQYTLTLTTLEPFRIGGKEDPLSGADNPVAVIGSRVCIPGATLKGAYRADLERWLNERFNTSGAQRWVHDSLKPCVPSTRLSSDEQALVKNGKYRGEGCAYQASNAGGRGRGQGDHRQGEMTPRTICPICYLLGSMGLVGFVNVPFLFTDVSYEALYSARLERVSGTVMKGANRAYQLVPPGSEFTGELEVLIKDKFLEWEIGKPRPLKENPHADEWLTRSNSPDNVPWTADAVLKYMVVERLQGIARIGGYRSKGFGKVKIVVKEMSAAIPSTA